MTPTHTDAQQLASLISKAEQHTSPFCTPKDDVLMVSLPVNSTDTAENRFAAMDSPHTLQQQQQSFIEPQTHTPSDTSTASASAPPSQLESENTTSLTDDMIKLIMSTELREKVNLFQSSNEQSNLLKKFLETVSNR